MKVFCCFFPGEREGNWSQLGIREQFLYIILQMCQSFQFNFSGIHKLQCYFRLNFIKSVEYICISLAILTNQAYFDLPFLSKQLERMNLAHILKYSLDQKVLVLGKTCEIKDS